MTGKVKNVKGKAHVLPSFRIEADAFAGRMELLVSSVVGIAELSECEIVLMMRREKIKICGKSLEVSIYERNTVEIRGNIFMIERSGESAKYGENNGKK